MAAEAPAALLALGLSGPMFVSQIRALAWGPSLAGVQCSTNMSFEHRRLQDCCADVCATASPPSHLTMPLGGHVYLLDVAAALPKLLRGLVTARLGFRV